MGIQRLLYTCYSLNAGERVNVDPIKRYNCNGVNFVNEKGLAQTKQTNLLCLTECKYSDLLI